MNIRNRHYFNDIAYTRGPFFIGGFVLSIMLCLVIFVRNISDAIDGITRVTLFALILFFVTALICGFNDVDAETHIDNRYGRKLRSALVCGFVLFLILETMLFCGFFGAFFDRVYSPGYMNSMCMPCYCKRNGDNVFYVLYLFTGRLLLEFNDKPNMLHWVTSWLLTNFGCEPVTGDYVAFSGIEKLDTMLFCMVKAWCFLLNIGYMLTCLLMAVVNGLLYIFLEYLNNSHYNAGSVLKNLYQLACWFLLSEFGCEQLNWYYLEFYGIEKLDTMLFYIGQSVCIFLNMLHLLLCLFSSVVYGFFSVFF